MNLTLIRILLCVCSFSWLVHPAHADELTAAKTADIQKLLKMTGATVMGEQLAGLTIQTLQQSLKTCSNCTAKTFEIIEQETLNLFRENIDKRNGLTDRMLVVYHKHFSHAEVRQLIAFYETPIGKRLVVETPLIGQEGLAVGQAWSQSLGSSMQSRFKIAFEKAKLPMPEIAAPAPTK